MEHEHEHEHEHEPNAKKRLKSPFADYLGQFAWITSPHSPSVIQ